MNKLAHTLMAVGGVGLLIILGGWLLMREPWLQADKRTVFLVIGSAFIGPVEVTLDDPIRQWRNGLGLYCVGSPWGVGETCAADKKHLKSDVWLYHAQIACGQIFNEMGIVGVTFDDGRLDPHGWTLPLGGKSIPVFCVPAPSGLLP